MVPLNFIVREEGWSGQPKYRTEICTYSTLYRSCLKKTSTNTKTNRLNQLGWSNALNVHQQDFGQWLLAESLNLLIVSHFSPAFFFTQFFHVNNIFLT